MANGVLLFFVLPLIGALALAAFVASGRRRQNSDQAVRRAKRLAQEHNRANIYNNPYLSPGRNGLSPPSRAWIAYEEARNSTDAV